MMEDKGENNMDSIPKYPVAKVGIIYKTRFAIGRREVLTKNRESSMAGGQEKAAGEDSHMELLF